MKLLRKQLTVANLLAGLALFLALGGGAYAAKATLARNSVKTPSIAKGAVTTAKLRNGAVATAKLRNGAVVGAKIATATIGTDQLAKGSVRSGQLGGGVVTEAKIKDGAVSGGKLSTSLLGQLVRNVTYASAQTGEDSEDSKSITAECPSGKLALAGGARLGGELKSVALTGSNPFAAANGSRTGWTAFAHETGTGQTEAWSLEAFVVCAEL